MAPRSQFLEKELYLYKGRYTNSYLLIGKKGILVIDVAAAEVDRLMAHIEGELQRTTSEIHFALATHDDPDHAGGLLTLKKKTGCLIAIPPSAWRPSLKRSRTRLATIAREIFRPRMWKMYSRRPDESDYEPLAMNIELRAGDVDFWLQDGEPLPLFHDWEVIATPGHSRDSVTFFNRKHKTAITGDTVLGSAKKARPVYPSIFEDREALRKSVLKLYERGVKRVCPAHGSIISGEDVLLPLVRRAISKPA